MSKKVLILSGGFSAEREISLISGRGVSLALRQSGYQVIEYDLTDIPSFIKELEKQKPDVVFNALHGNWGEDGEIQGLLDLLQIPYTHSGLKASAIGMDKEITKLICQTSGIKVPKGEKQTYIEFKTQGTKITMPYVIKPVSDGSSVGVYIIKSPSDLLKVDYKDSDQEILIEEYIEGKELTVSVLDGKALAVTEMRPKKNFYDYEAKYTDKMTEHILPADIPVKAYNTALNYAEKFHKILGCHSVSRTDMRYNEKDGVVVLEINTNPGMTPLSLVPEQFKYIGGSYEELCRILVEKAHCRKMSQL